jgi:gluconolactonase
MFVEQYRSQVSILEDGNVRSVANVGSNPSGLALGPDGLVYVCRNAGKLGDWAHPNPAPPAILALDIESGRFEVVTTAADKKPLRAPNDLCFSPDGELYFTDPSDFEPTLAIEGWICRHRGSETSIYRQLDNTFPNGLAIDLDGALVWVESHTRRVVRANASGSEVIAELGPGALPDGIAFAKDGRLVIATYSSGGIDIVTWAGDIAESERLIWAEDVCATNVAFQGSTLWLTDVNAARWADFKQPAGRLWRLSMTLEGIPLRGSGHQMDPLSE